MTRERRYSSSRWRKLAAYIRQRDPMCYVVDCPQPVGAADHIIPATLDMPDSQFYDPTNLRGSCRRHNTARGVAARLERELAGGVRPAPRRYSFGSVKRGASDETVFLAGHRDNDTPPAVSTHTERWSTVTADYSRNEAGDGGS